MASNENKNKNISRIESIIDDIERLIEHSKPSALSQTKIVVNKGELLELVRELRMKAPEEIKRYRKMMENHDAIIASADEKAKGMIAEAEANISNRIQDHEIVQQALSEADVIMEDVNRQADQVVYEAEREAEMIRRSSIRYMSENLSKLQNLIDSTRAGVEAKYKSMEASMEKYSALIRENREELYGTQKEEYKPEENNVEELEPDMTLQVDASDFE